MLFIVLVKFKHKPSKADIAASEKELERRAKFGVKTIGLYWTLGRYDAVSIVEAPDEKAAMKAASGSPDFVATETMVALKREDAVRLLD